MLITSRSMKNQFEAVPLKSLDDWEEDLLRRYPDPENIATAKSTEEYRNYKEPERDTVREFYRLNHTYQTFDFVVKKEAEFLSSIGKKCLCGRHSTF